MMKNLLTFVLWSFALIGTSTFCYAQPVKMPYAHASGFDYTEIVYGDSTDKFLPVVVAFHFSSSTPEELARYYDSLNTDVRIIMPRGNYPKREGYSYYPVDHYLTDSLTQAQTVAQVVDSVALFLHSIFERYPVKPIVTGISQGGDISFSLGLRYPHLIRGAVPLLGFIHRRQYLLMAKEAEVVVPIRLFHGAADEIVRPDFVRKEVKFLEDKFDLTLQIYPGVGHDVSPAMKRHYSEIIRKLTRGFGVSR